MVKRVGLKRIASHVESDGRTVWVHSPDGNCIGRFGPGGVDIHKSFQEQLDSGTQCLVCTHTRPNKRDWIRFKELMKETYSVTIRERFRPKFIGD